MNNGSRRPVIDRLMEKVCKSPGSCWTFTGALNHDGYGSIGLGGRRGRIAKAHRVAFEHLRGPIPDGLVLDHLCENRACVNPDHLQPVTQRENIRRAFQRETAA